jgi:hypothetical protein
MCFQLDDFNRAIAIASALFVAAGIALGVAIAMNVNPWTAVFGGGALAAGIAGGLILGAAAAIAAAFVALFNWYHCMTSRSGPVCHAVFIAASTALSVIEAALIFQAAQVFHAIPGSFIPGFSAPVLTVVLVALAFQGAAVIGLAVSMSALTNCIAGQSPSRSLTQPLAAPGGSGGSGSGSGSGSGGGSGGSGGGHDPFRVPELLDLLFPRNWIRDRNSGILIPLPLDPENCPRCIIALVRRGQITDITAAPDGAIESLSISGGELVAFDMQGEKQALNIPIESLKDVGKFSAFPGFSHLSKEGGSVRGVVIMSGKLHAVIGGTEPIPWKDFSLD